MRGMTSLHLNPSVTELNSLYNYLDLHHSGVLSYKDFYRLFEEEMTTELRRDRVTLGRLSPGVVKLT